MWEPYPGPRPQESTFVAHAHLGAVFKQAVDHRRCTSSTCSRTTTSESTAYTGESFNTFVHGLERARRRRRSAGVRYNEPKPRIMIYGVDIKQLHQWIGDGYLGFSHRRRPERDLPGDAIEVLHSFGGWQLHDNYFGPPGDVDTVTGKIDSFLFQYSFSFGQLLSLPAGVLGRGAGPDRHGRSGCTTTCTPTSRGRTRRSTASTS